MKYSHGEVLVSSGSTRVSDPLKGSFASLAESSKRLVIWSLPIFDAWEIWKFLSEMEAQLHSISSKLTGISLEYVNEARTMFQIELVTTVKIF